MAKKTASKSAPKKAADKVDKKTVKKVEAKKPAPVVAKKATAKAPVKTPTKATKPSLAEKIVAKAGKVVAQVEKAIAGKAKAGKTEAPTKAIVAKAANTGKAKAASVKEKSVQPVAKVSPPPVKQNMTKEKAVDGPKMMSKSAAAPAKSVEKSSDEAPKIKIDRQAMSEDEIRWAEFYNKHRTETPPEYNIREQYEAKKPILHKTFGWGYILSNEYDRLEVLFKDGKRMLISNRKV